MSTQPTTQTMLRIPRSAHPTPTEPRLRSRRLPAWAYVVVILVVFGGLLIAVGATPWYATNGRDAQAAKAGSGAGPVAADGAPGQSTPGAGTDAARNPAAGKGTGTGTDGANKVAPTSGDVADIKGWMTLQQVLDGYPVSKDALYQAFSIPADTPTSTTLQKLAESTGADVPAIRTWVADNQK